VEFDADDGFEIERGGEQESASHACAEVDEGGVGERGCGCGFLPTFDQGMKYGGGHAVIGGGMAVVWMAGFEMATGDEAAGLDAELRVEWMRSISVFDGEARKQTESSLLCCAGLEFSGCGHGLKVSISKRMIHF